MNLISSVPSILRLGREILSRLSDRIESPGFDASRDTVGDIFKTVAPYFKMYSKYATDFNGCLSGFQKECTSNVRFKKWVEERARYESRCRGLGIQAFLIMPIQRIPRYKLLLEELLKYTSTSHQDYKLVESSIGSISCIAQHINENVRHHQLLLQTLDLQTSLAGFTEPLLISGRKLIKAGKIRKIGRRGVEERGLWLFNDCLISAAPGTTATTDFWVFRRKFSLSRCEIRLNPSDGEFPSKNCFPLNSRP